MYIQIHICFIVESPIYDTKYTFSKQARNVIGLHRKISKLQNTTTFLPGYELQEVQALHLV